MTQQTSGRVPAEQYRDRSQLTETLHHQLFEKMALGVVFQDAQGHIVMANAAAEQILGMSFDQMQGRTSLDPRWRAVHEDGSDFPGPEHPASVALRTGDPVSGVIIGVFHPGENTYRWLSVNATPILEPGEQRAQGVFVTFEDVTARKLIEQRLQEDERRFRAMFEHAGIGMLQTLPDGRFVQANQKLCAILGYSQEELLALSYQDITSPDDLNQSVNLVQRALAGEFDDFCFEKQYLHKAGGTLWAQVTATLVHAADGTPLYFLTLVEDISQRKHWQDEREQMLAREQQARTEESDRANEFEAIFEAIADGICVYDQDGRVKRANRAAHSLLDVAPQKGHFQQTASARARALQLCDEHGVILTEAQWPLTRILHGEVLAGETAIDLIVTNMRGQTLQLATSGAPLYDAVGRLTGAVTIWRDVTERRRMETERMELLESERIARQQAEAVSRQLQTVLDVLPVGVILTDAQGRFIQINAALKHIWEVDALLLRDLNVHHVIWPDGRPVLDEENSLVRVLRDGTTITGEEIAIQTSTGIRKAILNSASPIRDETGAITGGVAAIIDITERRNLEQRTHVALDALLTMAEALVHTETTLPNAPEGRGNPLVQHLAMLTRDILGCERVSFRLISDESAALMPLAVVGLMPAEETQWYAARPLVALTEWLDVTATEQLYDGEVVLVDMQQLPYRDRPNPYHIRTFLAAPLQIADHLLGVMSMDYGSQAHDYQRAELALVRGVARLATFVLEREQLQREREHALVDLQMANEELAMQNQHVERANRLKSEFLANMSHELRTPLNGIIGFSEVLCDDILEPVSVTQREFLGDILTSAHHLLQLINDVLDISKIEADKMDFYPEDIDLATVVHEVCGGLRGLIDKKRQHLTIDIDPRLDTLSVDTAKLKQVLFNYLANAQKFTPEEGHIALRIFPSEVNMFTICVSDTGIGIEPADIARLFVVFQQLDSGPSKRFQGTGLGLALTKRIVEAQGGAVGVESSPHNGSTFWATLPRQLSDVLFAS